MNSIFDYSRQHLEEILLENGEKKYRATQIFNWLYKQNVDSFMDMTNISKNSQTKLNELFEINQLEIENVYESTDSTRKFLFKIDNDYIETVLMNHDYGYSVCVSTQIGCNMGCSFCASGMHKKIRNLLPSEMVLQVKMINDILVKENKRVSHVVIMGIGEPFDNYENTLEFIKIINDAHGLEIGSRHITVSTCGIVPKIYSFSTFDLQVNLAISLHFPNDELRSRYMKINKKYNIQELFTALTYYYQNTNRRITFEYILLSNINDTKECAYQLIDLVKNINCYINLIPLNKTNDLFLRSTKEQTKIFYEILIKNNINVTLRKEQGHDINAACGQLRITKKQEK